MPVAANVNYKDRDCKDPEELAAALGMLVKSNLRDSNQ